MMRQWPNRRRLPHLLLSTSCVSMWLSAKSSWPLRCGRRQRCNALFNVGVVSVKLDAKATGCARSVVTPILFPQE